MNIANTLAPHNANLPPHVQPLHIALAEMRERLATSAPGSLTLFNVFEPLVYEWANNPNALTHRDWLIQQWKSFFLRRFEVLSDRVRGLCFKPNNRAQLLAGLVELRDLTWAFAKHSVGKHPVLAGSGRALGRLSTYALIGTLFMASELIGRDLGDRLHAWWIGG